MIVFVLCMAALLLIIALGQEKELHTRRGQSVDNFNDLGQTSAWFVPMDEQRIIRELESGAAHTDLKYRWDGERREITLHEGLPNGLPEVAYALEFRARPGGTAMKVRQVTHLRTVRGAPGREYRRGGNRYAWLQNEFWQQKLGATPMPLHLWEEDAACP